MIQNMTTDENIGAVGRSDLEGVVSLPLPVAQRIFEHCWSAASKLESQIIRNHRLPAGYAEVVNESFKALSELHDAIISS